MSAHDLPGRDLSDPSQAYRETTYQALTRANTATARAARHRGMTLAALLLLVFGLFWARTLLGDFPIALPDFFRIVGGETVDVPGANYILMDSKLPRALAALIGGAMFGAAGAALQSLVRNPLASPDVMGLSLGSSTAAVFAATVLGWSGMSLAAAGVCGGLAVSAVILWLARGQVPRMILVGIAMAAALQSLIQWILINSSSFKAQDAMVWLAGSLADVGWVGIRELTLIGLPLIALLCVLAHRLRLLEMGDPMAAGLGVPVRRTQLLVLVGVVLAVAVATSVCGPIAFVPLLAGPIARRLMGRTSVLPAALVGAAITLAGDYVGAYLIPGGGKLPVGVITGLAGAPVLAWLLVSSQKGKRQ